MERVNDTVPGDATDPHLDAPVEAPLDGAAANDQAEPIAAKPVSKEEAHPEARVSEAGDPARSLAELRRAVRHGDEGTCVRLLSQSPSLSTSESERGGTLLLEAHERELPGVAGLLLDARAAAGDGRLDVHEAASMGRPAELRRILTEDPLSFEEVGPAGFFPLHRSAYRGNLDATILLLEMGADPRLASRNAAGLTPLHSAIAGAARFGDDEPHRYRAVVEHLLAGGADPDAVMEGGWTPRTAADRDGSLELLETLGGLPEAAAAPGSGPSAGSPSGSPTNSPAAHT